MRVALVSQILPATNYSRYLANALSDCLVYTDKREENLQTELKERVRLTFTKDLLRYPFEILKQAKRDNVKIVHLQHEFNMFGTAPLNAIEFLILPPLLRVRGLKVVTTIHAIVKPNQVDTRFLETFGWPTKAYWVFPIRTFLRFLYFFTCLFSNKVIVHSSTLKEILVKNYYCKNSKIAVTPHGIPRIVERDFNLRANPAKPESREVKIERPFILYFGYFHRRKGLEDLVNAFSKVSQTNNKVELVLAGGCLQKDFENRIIDLVKKHGLEEKVVFTGFVEEEQLRWLLSNCELVALPLTYSISASGPLAQAIAHYKPIITTDLGVSSKEIKHHITGLLVPPQNPTKLANAILELLNNKDLQKSIANNLKIMQKERDWSSIAKQTKSVYRSI